jgi:xeroderma pigmentosum group C-complementing protein
MLAEAAPSLAKSGEDGKTVKKRRVGGRLVTYRATEAKAESEVETGAESAPLPEVPAARVQQTVYDDSAESSDEDMEWEEVDLNQEPDNSMLQGTNDVLEDALLEIRLDKNAGKEAAPRIQRRKPVTGLEKKMRLDVHKAHLLCLIAHVYIRNHWCNDVGLQVSISYCL